MFQGVRIGEVTDIKVVFNPEDMTIWTPVYAQVEPERLTFPGGEEGVMARLWQRVKPQERLAKFLVRGLRAQLQTQSFVTGQLFVALVLKPETPVKLVGLEKKYTELPTVPTAMQEMAERIEKLPIEEILNKVLAAVDGIEKVVNSPEVGETLHSLHMALEDVRKLVRDVDAHVEPLASSIEGTFSEGRKLVRNVNKQVGPLASNVSTMVKDYGKLAREVDTQVGPLASSIEKTLETTRVALNQGTNTLAAAQADLGEDSPLLYELDNALKEVAAAARSIRLLADYLKRHPEALLQGKGKSGGK
jgi:paraquat-inducible protein B